MSIQEPHPRPRSVPISCLNKLAVVLALRSSRLRAAQEPRTVLLFKKFCLPRTPARACLSLHTKHSHRVLPSWWAHFCQAVTAARAARRGCPWGMWAGRQEAAGAPVPTAVNSLRLFKYP